MLPLRAAAFSLRTIIRASSIASLRDLIGLMEVPGNRANLRYLGLINSSPARTRTFNPPQIKGTDLDRNSLVLLKLE
jgi:hypothetical protein